MYSWIYQNVWLNVPEYNGLIYRNDLNLPKCMAEFTGRMIGEITRWSFLTSLATLYSQRKAPKVKNDPEW